MRVVIADDEVLALERLRTLFQQIPGTEVVGEATNGTEALQTIVASKPDIVMLDIEMPDLNGLAVATMIPIEQRPEIIFITAFEHYAADAFNVEASDYLLKPVQFDRLWQAIERSKRRHYLRSLATKAEAEAEVEAEVKVEEVLGNPIEILNEEPKDGLWAQTRDGAVLVPFSSVDWIEAQRDYVVLHTATRSHMVRMPMRTLEGLLDQNELMRVHRSAFARPSNVVEVRRLGRTINRLVLRDGAVVPVGPNYARDVGKRLGYTDSF